MMITTRWSDVPREEIIRRSAARPKVGEHNEEVLGGLLGYSEEEIAKLYANDVIGNWHHYDTLPG